VVRPALDVVSRLSADGMVLSDGLRVRLTPQGRMLSNEVFQEFLGLDVEDERGDGLGRNPAQAELGRGTSFVSIKG